MKKIYVLNKKELNELKKNLENDDLNKIYFDINSTNEYLFECRYDDFFIIWKLITRMNATDSFTYLKNTMDDFILLLDQKLVIKKAYTEVKNKDVFYLLQALKKSNNHLYTQGYGQHLQHMLNVLTNALKKAMENDLVIVICLSQMSNLNKIMDEEEQSMDLDDDFKFLLSLKREKLSKEQISVLKSWLKQ